MMESISFKDLSIEEIHKEIDLIQSCISKMANNSFLIKGWLITLISIVVALSYDKINFSIIAGILIIIVLCFWYLDAFFLRAERLYIKLYEWVVMERPKGNREKLYDLNLNRFNDCVDSIGKIMISETLRVFYCIPVLLIIFLYAMKIFQ